MKPIISIVVPSYNEEKNLEKLLISVTKQNFPQFFEMILVDNNSSDRTVEIAKKYQGKIKDFKIVSEKVKSIGAARAKGCSLATADIIASTDSDCILEEEWLGKILFEFNKNPEIVGVVGTYQFESKGKIFNFLSRMTQFFFDNLNFVLTGTFSFRGNNFAIKRQIYEKAGGFNANISALEDVELSLRVKNYGRIVYKPGIYVTTSYRRFHGNFLPQFIQRMRAYFYRVILRRNDKALEWDVIR